MMKPDITNVSDLKKYAANMECNIFNFYDEDGNHARDSYKKAVTFECVFIDGTVAQVSMSEWEQLKDLTFNLRQNREHDN